MKIGIDCRLAGTAHAGIGRYIQNLLRYLLDNSDHHWHLFFYNKKQAKTVLQERISLPHVSIIYTPVKHYTFAEQLLMPLYFYRAKLDLLHVPHFNVPLLYKKPFVVTIHDLLWHHHRGSDVTTLSRMQYWFKYLFYRLIVRQAIFGAEQIIVPAKTVKNTITNYFNSITDKITVTYEGVDEALLKSNAPREPKEKTLLYVGSLYPHKNIRLVIAALPKLPGYTLEIVGSRNVFTEQTKEFVASLNLEKRIRFLGYLSDAELQKKYLHVTALVQPSLSEGFGLTGVEAMALGTPVLASDIPIFKEIYSEGAIYFDPHQVSSFVSVIYELKKTNLEQLENTAKKIATKYQWDKMAAKTVSIYESTQ